MGPIIVGIVITVAVICATIVMVFEQAERTKRANKTLDVIKAALENGKDPAPELYRTLEAPGAEKTDQHWLNVGVFGVLGLGFAAVAWNAYLEGDTRFQAFAIIAAGMIVTAIGSAAFALFVKKPPKA